MKVKFVNSRGQGKFNAPRYFTQGAMSGANGEIRFSPPSSPQERTGEFQESRSASIISSPIHRKASARTLSTAPTIYSSPSFASLRSTRSENELLTFFQSGPLVYEDEDYNLKPVGMLDFKTERNVLRNALAHAEVKVDVTFDYACTDRLSKFLIQGRGRVLHYSGHGHSQYLAIEDCWGKMHPLNVDDLKGWIKAGREQLLLVFVSACHSRAAGDAFIEAGVKHVVCCKRDDQLLRNDAAIEFEKAFYQALANGRTLREAFEHGRHKVKTSNQMNPEVAQSEAQNFVLLPEGKDHNVKIFDPDIPPRPREICAEEQALISGGYNGMIPNPPDNFEGRQIEMFQVLSALKEHRLVRVTGPRGIGKCSVVRGVCKYIRERFHVFANTISHIVWLDQIDEDGKLGLSVLSDDENDFFHEKNSFTSLLEKALFFLKDRQVLLLIDARKLKCVSVFDEFLRDIIQMTDDTKVILIERSSGVGRIQRLQPSEKEVHIRPLSFLSTLHLFGKLCPHVDNQRCAEMWNLKALRGLILPEGLSSGELDTKVGMDIYEMIGAGIPSNIQEVADSISIERYKRLVILLDGMRRVRSSKTELHFQTRTELENEISDVTKQEQEAVKNCDYKQAGILKTLLDELMKLREHLKPLAELEEMEQIRSTRLNSALSKREYDDAAAIWEELLSLRRKIEAENSAIRGRRILKRHTSHFGLAARLSTLNQEFEKAMSEDRYAEAKHLRSQVLSLEQQLSRKRSLEELKNELKRIIDKLMEAKATANCELCEDLTRERLTLERLIIIENEARSSPDSLDSFQDVTIPPEYQASTTPCKNEPKLGKRRLHTFSDNVEGKGFGYQRFQWTESHGTQDFDGTRFKISSAVENEVILDSKDPEAKERLESLKSRRSPTYLDSNNNSDDGSILQRASDKLLELPNEVSIARNDGSSLSHSFSIPKLADIPCDQEDVHTSKRPLTSSAKTTKRRPNKAAHLSLFPGEDVPARQSITDRNCKGKVDNIRNPPISSSSEQVNPSQGEAETSSLFRDPPGRRLQDPVVVSNPAKAVTCAAMPGKTNAAIELFHVKISDGSNDVSHLKRTKSVPDERSIEKMEKMDPESLKDGARGDKSNRTNSMVGNQRSSFLMSTTRLQGSSCITNDLDRKQLEAGCAVVLSTESSRPTSSPGAIRISPFQSDTLLRPETVPDEYLSLSETSPSEASGVEEALVVEATPVAADDIEERIAAYLQRNAIAGAIEIIPEERSRGRLFRRVLDCVVGAFSPLGSSQIRSMS